ncbi:indole-3-glycerol phosphate lyase, chloroplastic isoform X2 [Brachypodium distachyon]|uniref:indole-3-glycerol phosphate lyase, chloroplastic isoform X2 n=1 Tax=Brachypodium distachyon TaxID=15368 RepID=UPI000D0E2479|nr:indole-3-glycerol phosphate lyase, chloroplastic isoform X2 [Brachypodium distachyon]|eukprot:XP_024314079.1 indole-3-glycerol phosphate lyase, chloroplastic isoform X2 [Brachypodium distachyon]
MAFALKASPSSTSSSSSAPSNHPRLRSAAAMAMPTPGRPASRAVAAASAAASLEPAVVTPSPDSYWRAPLPLTPAASERIPTVAQAMSRARAHGKTAFIPYITAGDPDLGTTAEALRLLDALGADVIELGMPFSDPSADGAVIQASAKRALAAGATTDAVMAMLREVTPELSCPVVIFSYFNPIVRRGTRSFAAAAREAGVKGRPYHTRSSIRRDTCIQERSHSKQSRAGAPYNTSYTSREDEGNRKSFRRVCLPGKCSWSYWRPCKREPACQGSS